MMTSPYEWKILEWDDQTNKHYESFNCIRSKQTYVCIWKYIKLEIDTIEKNISVMFKHVFLLPPPFPLQ